MKIELSTFQEEALKEAFNISMGRAAASLNEMVNEEVSLTVPNILFVSSKDFTFKESYLEEKELCFIKQHFAGTFFNSDAVLIFTNDESMELIRLFLNENTISADNFEEFTDLQQEAMSEIGNIILNSCIASFAEMLKDNIKGTLPLYARTNSDKLFDHLKVSQNHELVLLLYIDFKLKTRSISGYLLMMLEISNFNVFMNRLLENMDLN